MQEYCAVEPLLRPSTTTAPLSGSGKEGQSRGTPEIRQQEISLLFVCVCSLDQLTPQRTETPGKLTP